jgi:hypothetical protein
MSKILWGFDIKPFTDSSTGKPVLPNTEPFSVNGIKAGFAGGAVRVAHPFKLSITPRSAKHVAVIEKELAEVLPLLQEYE